MTAKPSFAAAPARRSSRVIICRDCGRCPAATNAAASCNASAARNGCTRSIRSAVSRIESLGSISFQISENWPSRRKATASALPSTEPSRSRRVKAETHSTSDPHQTSMLGSSAASSCMRLLVSHPRAAVQSQTHPRISPPFPPLLNESGDHRRFASPGWQLLEDSSAGVSTVRAGRTTPSRMS